MNSRTLAITAVLLAGLVGAAHGDEEEIPFGAAVVIIELTDNDSELQAFVDGVEWKRLQIFDPRERTLFDTEARGRLETGRHERAVLRIRADSLPGRRAGVRRQDRVVPAALS